MPATQNQTTEHSYHIDQHHYDEFIASAIKPSIIEKNFRTITDSREVDRLLNRNAKRRTKHSDHLVPCWAVTGLDPLGWERVEDGVQIKPDIPELGANGKPQKYIGATGYDAAPLFLETDDIGYWEKVLSDLAIPLFITEGAKKAAAGLSINRATVSVPGVSTCRKLGRLHRHLEVFCKFGRTSYLCFDNDTMQKRQVQHALLGLAREVAAVGSKVMVIMLPPGEAKGMDDYIAMHGKEAFNKLVEDALTIEEWRKQLEAQWNKESANEDEDFEKDKNLLAKFMHNSKVNQAIFNTIRRAYDKSIRFNELSLEIEIRNKPVDLEILEYTVDKDTGLALPYKTAKAMVHILARENSYHPVKDYLEKVSGIYSNTEILDNLSSKLFGTTHPLHNTFLKKWLLAGVARIMEPGCKADDILILHGLQGLLKSTFFETIASKQWFSDSCEGVGNDKDSLLQMHNAWILELAEIDRFLSNRNSSDLKKSLSIKTDKFRAPYGRGIEEFKRKFILAGSTNADEFLTDPTGNRRYWVIPVTVAAIDIEWLTQHRDEIWAAAVHLYKAGHKWYLNSEEKAQHAKLTKPFEVSDAWAERFQDYLDNGSRNQTTVSDLMNNCLQLDVHLQTKQAQSRITSILRAMGWIHTQRRMGSAKKSWIRPSISNSEVGADVGAGVGAEMGAVAEVATTLTNTQFQNINNSTAPTAPVDTEKNTLNLEVTTNNVNSGKIQNVSQIEEGAGADRNNESETPSNQGSQSVPLPPHENAPTSQESTIEEKTEELRALLEGGAPKDKDEVVILVNGWTLGEKSQVKAKLTPDQEQQLRDLVG